MALYGIVGSPLAHSMSPVLHNWGFTILGRDDFYTKWEILPEKLASFMEKIHNENIQGVSVTIPHKEKICDLLDICTQEAKDCGAVNTLFWQGNKLVGHNTDIDGFLYPLRAQNYEPRSALILGSGGAAHAVICGLQKINCKIYITTRSNDIRELKKNKNIEQIFWENKEECTAELLVNTTPLGMSGKYENNNPWNGDLTPFEAVYDLVYNPLETLFTIAAKKRGKKIFSGLDMFVAQGVAQFKLWTNEELSMREARILILQHLKNK